MADHEPMMGGGCGDPALSQELREALALLREHSDDEDFRTLVDDVLTGRCSLVDASSTDASVQGVRRFMAALARETRVSATTLQTVGSKGYDGFTLAVVNE